MASDFEDVERDIPFIYDTIEEAKATIQADAKAKGYEIATKRSHPDRITNELRRVVLVCSRGVTYKARPSKKPRDRNTSTIKCDCPWEIRVLRLKEHKKWEVVVIDASHNHEPAEEASALPGHRRRELNEVLDVIEQSARQTPAEIVDRFRKSNQGTTIQLKDIYNVKRRLRRKRLGKYTPTQLLLKALHRDNCFVKFLLEDKSKRVKRLFFVNKHVADILRKNPEVIMMDCTYKTNKYKMPLLIIMGHTALGTSFCIGFAFLEKEEEEDFTWVMEHLKALYRHLGLKDPEVIVTDRDLALMNAIATVFASSANLLCVWHVNTNVLKNCKPAFDTEEKWKEFEAAWQQVVNADFGDDFNTAWRILRQPYGKDYEAEVIYLKDTWLRRHRHRFCKAWTNLVTHFNTTTTSRVEGGHRVLKSVLKTSTGDLLTVVDGIELILNRQYTAWTHKLAQEKMKVAYRLPRDLMRDLIGRVSPYALSKVYDQYTKVKRADKDPEEHELKECGRLFMTTMGLPCAHVIKANMEAEEQKLLLEDVHPHWRFKKSETSLLTPTNNFFSDSLPTEIYEAPPERFDDSFSESSEAFDDFADDSELLPEVGTLLNDRRNRIVSQLASSAAFLVSEDAELNDLLNIAEPSVAKAKGRPRGSQNKKGIMTRAEKKAARFTKRDLSGFEHVEREYEARAKRAKKNTTGEATRGRRGRGGGGRGGGGRGGGGRAATTATSRPTTPMTTRAGANASRPMELSSNTESESEVSDKGFSDDGFNNLPQGIFYEDAEDEGFNASKMGDEDLQDEWMQ